MVETTLWCIENKGLFSNHYLENQLLMLDEWKEPNNIEEIFSKIKALYRDKKMLFPNANESQLREDFLNPVLKEYLGHYYKVEGKTEGASKYPDYGLFPDEKSADEAVKYQGTEDFYKKAIGICEAKAWEIKLDERDPKNPEQDKRPPNSQIDEYLRWSEKKWGILTNGRFWRLYYRENSHRNYYYQVDLAEIIEKDDVKAFKYFFLFFRKEAFDVDDKLCFLDRVYQGSVDYAKDISENLEGNVYKAMKTLAEGFINWAESNLTKTEEDLKVIQENTMKFLYRLLFIFFAEAKGLLDISQKTSASKNYAEHYSLDSLKKKIKNKIKSGEDIPAYLDSYYNQLQTLFNFIDNGTEVSGIPKEKLYIPSYNGGLFDAEKNKFLSEKKIGDHYLARAIDLLASTEGKKPEEKGFIDYSSLDIRHLGSIYEGLLEYKLKLATEPMVAVKEKGKEKWVPESEFKGKKSIERVDANEIYLATDKGGRKATGSYYTPEYIVKYIVENTLTPIVKEKIDKAIENNNKCSDAILSIKVLDPAMGSGHFLVEAVDFLGQRLGDAINSDIKRGLLKEGDYSDDWLRREIVSNCIYGVDLNLMAVELAKVSLWLKTISKDKPLSFLDHRLKCGNSLIGAHLIDLPWHPSKKRDETQRRLDVPEGFIKKLVETIEQLTAISDDTLGDIKKKEEIFTQLKNVREYDMIKTLADVRTSIYFGNEVAEGVYGNYSGDAYHSSESQWKERREKWFAKKGREIAENKHFFHWELEFPEIFFEEGKIKENPGFDAVVGNPPYVSSVGFLNEDREFFMNRYETAIKRFDIYNLFCEVGLTLIRNNGFNSFILPYPVLNQNYSEKLREVLLKKSKIYQIIDLSETKVFKDAIVRNCILVLEKDVNEGLCLDNIITIYKTTDSPNNLIMPFSSVSQKVYLSLPKNMFRIELSPDLLNLFEKINKISIKSVDICYVARGAVIHSEIENKKKEEYIGKVKINENFKPYIEGEDIERFSLVHRNLFLEYKPSVQYRPAFPELFENEKLLVYKVTGKKGLIVAYDNMNFYNNESLYNCILKYLLINAKITGSHGHSIKENEIEISKKYNLKYILSLFNSALLNIIYQKLYGYELNVYPDDIKNLPIRRISFTTPKEEREKLAVELKQKYQNENVDEILKMVEKCLPKDKLGNFLTEKEKSDVVHNFLAFLAEQMIEMNKEKNAEIKSFLDFLKGEIGASIEELSNKTAIQEYCKNEFQKLIEVLVKNKKKLRAGYDPKSPTSYKHLLEWYNASIDKLRPLMGRIEATDKIIDQIVYKLYGLTNEEIKIVEGNVSKKETSTS